MERPENITNDHLGYLDSLRDSGVTNMLGAASYVQRHFDVPKKESVDILKYWIKTFGQEDR